jgi:valyl-tRNA synthetase
VRGEMNISPTQALQVLIQSEDEKARKIMETHQDLIINLARLSSLEVQNTGKRPKSSATAVVNSASIFVLLEGIIDFAKESKRLEKEIQKLAANLTTVTKKLENEDFLSKAPSDIIEKVRKKQSVLLEKQQKIQTNLDRIKEMEA